MQLTFQQGQTSKQAGRLTDKILLRKTINWPRKQEEMKDTVVCGALSSVLSWAVGRRAEGRGKRTGSRLSASSALQPGVRRSPPGPQHCWACPHGSIYYQNSLFATQLKFKAFFSNECSKKQMGKVLNLKFQKLLRSNKTKESMSFTACFPLTKSPFSTLKRYQSSNY